MKIKKYLSRSYNLCSSRPTWYLLKCTIFLYRILYHFEFVQDEAKIRTKKNERELLRRKPWVFNSIIYYFQLRSHYFLTYWNHIVSQSNTIWNCFIMNHKIYSSSSIFKSLILFDFIFMNMCSLINQSLWCYPLVF